MSVYTQIDLLPSLLNEFQDLQIVAVKDLMSIPSYILKYPHIKFVEGDRGLVEVATSSCDLVVNALVGFVGLIPTIQAILNHKEIALANKETLVAGGEVVMRLAKENQVHIYPIDSEHSAIFQCMEKNEIHKIILKNRKICYIIRSEVFRTEQRMLTDRKHEFETGNEGW